MNVFLIYPGMAQGFGSYERGGDWINHGLGIISAILKKEGHRVDYLDLRQLSGWPAVTRRIQETPFDAALISLATVDFDAAVRIAQTVKAKSPALKVIVGGPHPTLMTDETAGVNEFDHIFTHEAEITLPGVIRDLGRAPRLIKGEMPTDLDAVSFVDRSLSPKGESALWSQLPGPFFTITGSRGCMYNCTFCQPAERLMFGMKIRRRSAGNIVSELESLRENYGMRSFMIHDDCFTQFPAWAEEFCAAKKQRGLDMPFVCQSRADIICNNSGLMARLADAGLKWVMIGFESGSDRVLQYIRKGVTVEENLRAAKICRAAGVKIFANYMFGLPTETEAEMRETVRMIRAIRPERCSPSVFTPAPGSHLYDECRKEQLILVSSSTGYRRDALIGGAKIKGVDYATVHRMVFESIYGPARGRMYHMIFRAGSRALRVLYPGDTGPKSRVLRVLWQAGAGDAA
jgi:anaerobic magnesium-protoporphyrin IX monomethyl ester cyclase